MIKSQETWTRTHDLALIYLALAYGSDARLADSELHTIIEALKKWDEKLSHDTLQEVVLEAMAIYLEDDAQVEFTRTIRSLNKDLSEEERKIALEDVVQIAEADGVLHSIERSLITLLAENWGLKGTGKALLEQSSAAIAENPSWTLLHDMSLICLVLAHSADGELSPIEIETALQRLHQWQPDLAEEELRNVFRDALNFYSSQPDKEALAASLKSIKEALPLIQRVAFIDDLVCIARVDGGMIDNERELIRDITGALGV